MINYPNGKKYNSNNSLSSKSNMGMGLEEIINLSNSYYDNKNIALITKRPTNIKVIKTSDKYKISEACFLSPSTLDYVGVYKSKYLDFDAKETKNIKGLPLKNIAKHQFEAMEKIVKHGGISFLIIYLSSYNEIYFLDSTFVLDAYNDHKTYISYELIKEKGHLVKNNYMCPCDYLKIIDEFYL